MIIQDAMREAFKDADFHREYKKLTGEEPDPLMPEEMESDQGNAARRRGDRSAKKTFRRGLASRAIRLLSPAKTSDR